MLKLRFDVTLTLAGPLMTRATAAGGYGLDSSLPRDAATSAYFIAGTLVKGRLRDAWLELHDAAGADYAPDVDDLLGAKAGNSDAEGSGVAPRRGRLHFTDFQCASEAAAPEAVLFRIQIDAERGAVKHGAHQVIEAPFGPGQAVCFQGAVAFVARDTDEAQLVRRQVETGLRWITSLGGLRTVGFGRLIDVAVARAEDAPAGDSGAVVGADALDLLVTPRAPFCIARQRPNDNLFESESVIPGGVLKGALAATWLARLGQPGDEPITRETDPDRPALGEHFSAVRFTHAVPAKPGPDAKRPVVLPLSVVAHGKSHELFDVALEPGPLLIDSQAPVFAIDWKSDTRQKADTLRGWAEPARELRVRTAIDGETRRAKDGQLFAQERVVPTAFVWHGRIDLGAVSARERAQVERELRTLLVHGLRGLGKTKAHAAVELRDARPDGDYLPSQSADTGPWVVTLQTPALLLNASDLSETSGERELRAAYEAAFADLGASSLRLVRYFASQRLAGGFYLHRRFHAGERYRPYLLTEPGSVFVLEASTAAHAAQARDCIAGWQQHGLPLPASLGKLTWRSCPYVPENGYGEVRVNLKLSRVPAERATRVAILGGE